MIFRKDDEKRELVHEDTHTACDAAVEKARNKDAVPSAHGYNPHESETENRETFQNPFVSQYNAGDDYIFWTG